MVSSDILHVVLLHSQLSLLISKVVTKMTAATQWYAYWLDQTVGK